MKSSSKEGRKEQWDPSYASFMDYMLTIVKTKQAAEVGTRAVDYFRGQDFRKFLLAHSEYVEKKFPEVLDGGSICTNPEEVDSIGTRLIRKGFVYKAAYKPLSGTVETNENGEVKRPKWPKRLQICQRQMYDDSGFYVVLYEGNKTWRYIMLGAIISVVLLLCMFPAWPLWTKLGVWYSSVFFMTFILASVFIRLVGFVLLWFFGVDFWIFPNLFDEEAGVVESFTPLISFEKRNDDWMMLVARLFCAVLLAGAMYKLQETHSVTDVGSFAKQSLLDVLNWGHHKLAEPPPSKSKYPSLNDIAEGTHDDGLEEEAAKSTEPSAEPEENFSCLKKCGFDSYDEVLQECLNCACLTELLASPCYKHCSPVTQKSLTETMKDTCYEEQQMQQDEL